MQIRIAKWGNSQGIRLSKNILASIGIADPINQKLEINVEDGKIIIEKAPQVSKLAERFKNFDLDNYRKNNENSKELNWGSNVGKELI